MYNCNLPVQLNRCQNWAAAATENCACERVVCCRYQPTVLQNIFATNKQFAKMGCVASCFVRALFEMEKYDGEVLGLCSDPGFPVFPPQAEWDLLEIFLQIRDIMIIRLQGVQ